jgi:hypothetical protein
MFQLFSLAIDCQELRAVVAVAEVAAVEAVADWGHMQDWEDILEVGRSLLVEDNLAEEDSRHIAEVPIDHTL